MVDLIDLAPGKASYEIDGQKLEIVGLSIAQITKIFQRFDKLGDLTKAPLIQVIKDAGSAAAGAIIAAGVGKPDDEKYEAKGAGLPFGVQVDLIDAIIKITTPKGDGPLAKGLSEFVGMFVPVMTAQAAIAAASPNSSQSPPPASPATGAAPKTSGT